MERIPALLLAGVILAAGCGSGAEEETRTGAPPDDAGAAPATSNEERLYRGTGTVLEQGAGPQLCFSTLDSYPPQCGGGVELHGWDWSEATGYESANGTRWGSYEIVGHWDGESLAVVRFGPPNAEGAGVPAVDVDRLATPCPAPEGGWAVPRDTPRLGLDDNAAMLAYVESQPEYSASWVDTSTDPNFDPAHVDEYVHDFAAVVTVVRFTHDVERHEAAMRALWGGPLCVVEGGVARTDLERILDEVSGQVETTWANLDLVGGRVEVGVNVVDPDVQAALDRQYGEGAVVLHGHLEPVE
jgi:hypothetical protein